MFLIDSNIVILFLKRRSKLLETRIREAVDQAIPIAMPAIVYQELLVGVLRSEQQVRARRKLQIFMDFVGEIVAFDQRDAACAAEIDTDLMRRGLRIGAYDLLVAAQAVSRNAILVTHNQREFSRIAALRWQDWTVPA